VEGENTLDTVRLSDHEDRRSYIARSRSNAVKIYTPRQKISAELDPTDSCTTANDETAIIRAATYTPCFERRRNYGLRQIEQATIMWATI